MGRASYDLRDEYVGTGSLSTYTFDFKIEELSQLLVIELDASGVETQRVRGTDVTYLNSVTFDSVEGGGTVTLAANLTTSYKLILLQANDAPTQPNEFKNKFDFTLRKMEMAFDWIAGAAQRAHYLAFRSVRFSEHVTDISTFDTELPAALIGTADTTIATNATGDGFAVGPSVSTILSAIAAAAAAAASAAAALVSETAAAASAAAALVSETNAAASAAAAAAGVWTPHAVTDGQSATALSGEDWLSADYSSVPYEFEVSRGTTVTANGRFACQKQNGTWRIRLDSYVGEIHGVTWSLTGTTTQQLNAALDSGAGNGTIKLSRKLVNQ